MRSRAKISDPHNFRTLGPTVVQFSGKIGHGTLFKGFERPDAPVDTFSARGRQKNFWRSRERRSYRVPMGSKNTGPGFLGAGMSKRVHLT
jgi:hypothetical protein